MRKKIKKIQNPFPQWRGHSLAMPGTEAGEDTSNALLESFQNLDLEQCCQEEADATTAPFQRGYAASEATYDSLCKELADFSLKFRKPKAAAGAAPVIYVSEDSDDDFDPEDIKSSSSDCEDSELEALLSSEDEEDHGSGQPDSAVDRASDEAHKQKLEEDSRAWLKSFKCNSPGHRCNWLVSSAPGILTELYVASKLKSQEDKRKAVHTSLLTSGAYQPGGLEPPEPAEEDGLSKSAKRRRLARHSAGAKPRARVTYTVLGNSVCKTLFCHAFGVSSKVVKNVLKSFADGMINLPPRKAGSGKFERTTKNSTAESAALFITNYAELHGYPCPEARGSKKDVDRVIVNLPHSHSKGRIYKLYCACCSGADVRPLSRTSFYRVWSKRCHHIKRYVPRLLRISNCFVYVCLMLSHTLCCRLKLRTDYCDTCIRLRAFSRQGDLLKLHLAVARLCRNFKQEMISKSIKSFYDEEDPRKRSLHLSFDYAQKIQLPMFDDQPGQYYFKKGLVVDIFGVASDTHVSSLFQTPFENS